jgi:hypothetical protein
LPGRNPAEAARAFLDPLRVALGCVAHARITAGEQMPGKTLLWTINGGTGAALSNGRLLHASMRYRLIEDDGEGRGPWRATTEGYIYKITEADGAELVQWHWHPDGASDERDPHYHFAAAVLAPDGIFTPKTHVPSPRVTFEEVVRRSIDWAGAAPLCDDWRDRLDLAEAPHRLYRTWHVTPSERDGAPRSE